MRHTSYYSVMLPVILFVCGILFHGETRSDTVITNQISFSISSRSELAATWREIIKERSDELATNRVAFQQGVIYSALLMGLQHLDPKRVMSPDPRVREAAAKDLIGQEKYGLLEKRYLGQLTAAASTTEEKAAAALILGWVLVSGRAEQPLTDLAEGILSGALKDEDPRLGVTALQGLTALGDEDAAKVLTRLLISQKFSDALSVQIVKILKLSHTRLLEEHALELLEQSKDRPGLGYELLFAIKGRKDIMDIIVRLFKGDCWMPENKESGDMDHRLRALAVTLLMDEICSKEELCKNDPELRQKIVDIAETSVVKLLYSSAFLYLRREGTDEAYFERLLATPGMPPSKQEHIKRIIKTMKSGVRLKFEENPVTTLFYEPN